MTAHPDTERTPRHAAAAAQAPTPARVATGAPAGHLVCDLQGRVCWSDDIGAAALASAEVLLLQADGRLGVRSHWLGLLALRSAMRRACLGAAPVPVTLRHGHHEVQVAVHALPCSGRADADLDAPPQAAAPLRALPVPHVLLALRPQRAPFTNQPPRE